MDKILKIGVIREGKNPPDFRVPITPNGYQKIKTKYPEIDIKIQSSPTRTFSDSEYKEVGAQVVEDVSDCDILLGVKEVKIDDLVPEKTYFFFSHTIKKQPYNQPLMHAMIQKKIQMIDYETLVDEENNRLIGFGYYAGIVGAHHALVHYGRKKYKYDLKLAKDCKDYEEVKNQYKYIDFPVAKFIVTGTGKVAKGACQVMEDAGFKKVDPQAFLTQTFDYPVYVQLTAKELYKDENNQFDKADFYQNPSRYHSDFHQYARVGDVLINGIFWNDKIVRLFEEADVQQGDLNIQVISDVTCDVFGSVPLTIKTSTIADPVFGIHRETLDEVVAYLNNGTTIDMMTIDNLPNELSRDASEGFCDTFIEEIIPELLKKHSDILERATICKGGQLTQRFSYLADYAY